jgi:iron(III) transport system substrate-binding protein
LRICRNSNSKSSSSKPVHAILSGALIGLAILASCERHTHSPTRAAADSAQREVVVYTALDREFSEPILDDFTARTGIAVRAAYDTESTKTVGLVNRIRAEANRPRCDVFWNNEILNTVRLKAEGLLQPCHPAEAASYPEQYRDPDGNWYGFAARARVLLVNTTIVREAERPRSIRDLADPRWHGRIGLAKPLFGTTASHVACLFALLGDGPAQDLLAAFKRNEIQVVAGNKECAEMVGAGRLAVGLTDTDDALGELDAGRPVQMVFPDSAAGEMGTLVLPNTLALIKGAPHPDAGVQLINYLLSAEVEERLALGPSGQIPLHRAARSASRLGNLKDVRPMTVDFSRAAAAFTAASDHLEREFLAP